MQDDSIIVDATIYREQVNRLRPRKIRQLVLLPSPEPEIPVTEHQIPEVVMPDNPDLPTIEVHPTKRCPLCKKNLPHDSFATERASKTGLKWACRECVRAYARRQYHSSHEAKEQASFRSKLRLYGITQDEYNARLEEQMGVCAICCGVPPRRRPLVVDHDHKTGKIRALLCTACNVGLGGFRDDPRLMRTAIAYLELHGK